VRRFFFVRGVPEPTAPAPAPPLPDAVAARRAEVRYDNVGIAVERSVEGFVGAARLVPAIHEVRAKSVGPRVEFLVVSSGDPGQTTDALEEHLFPMVRAGLPVPDYEVVEDASDSVGYSPIYAKAEFAEPVSAT
jgi:hypothetical protein